MLFLMPELPGTSTVESQFRLRPTGSGGPFVRREHGPRSVPRQAGRHRFENGTEQSCAMAAEIESLELLSAFATLLVPEAVSEEIESGGVPDESSEPSYELVEAHEDRAESDELDAGERAALAVERSRGRSSDGRPRRQGGSVGRGYRSTRLCRRDRAR